MNRFPPLTSRDFEHLRRLHLAAARIDPKDAQLLGSLKAKGEWLAALEAYGPRLIDEAYKGAASALIVSHIAALVPLDKAVEVNQTGATLVAWLKTIIDEHGEMKSRANDKAMN